MPTDSSNLIEGTRLRIVPSEFPDSVDVPLAPPRALPERLPRKTKMDRIQSLAYQLWKERGCPFGSPDDDWFRAEKLLDARRSEAALPILAFGIERRTG